MAGLSDTDIAYMAGIFDGEGWVGINTSKPHGKHKSPRYSLYMGVANTYIPVLEMFAEEFGGHIKLASGKNKPCYSWRTTSHKAAHVLKVLMPYLRIKKDQALVAIEYVEKHCDSDRTKVLTKRILADREFYKQKIVSLR